MPLQPSNDILGSIPGLNWRSFYTYHKQIGAWQQWISLTGVIEVHIKPKKWAALVTWKSISVNVDSRVHAFYTGLLNCKNRKQNIKLRRIRLQSINCRPMHIVSWLLTDILAVVNMWNVAYTVWGMFHDQILNGEKSLRDAIHLWDLGVPCSMSSQDIDRLWTAAIRFCTYNTSCEFVLSSMFSPYCILFIAAGTIYIRPIR